MHIGPDRHAQTNGLVAGAAGWRLVEEANFGLWMGGFDPIWATHPRAWHDAFPSGFPRHSDWRCCGPHGTRSCERSDRGRGDLAVRVAERDQSENLELARAEVVGRPGGRWRLGGEPGSELRVEVGPALCRKPDGLDEFPCRLPPSRRSPTCPHAGPRVRKLGRCASSAPRFACRLSRIRESPPGPTRRGMVRSKIRDAGATRSLSCARSSGHLRPRRAPRIPPPPPRASATRHVRPDDRLKSRS
jgi:hypothetical protein